MLDPAAFEDIEADAYANLQAVVVVAGSAAAAAFAMVSVKGLSLQPTFAIALAGAVGAWIIWAMLISAVGTMMVPETQTRSSPVELFRTIGFAAAPGVFYALAAMPATAPFITTLVTAWLMAATIIAVRQALDYRSTLRAVAVCLIASTIFGAVGFLVATLFTATVS